MLKQTLYLDETERAVDALLTAVGNRVVVGTPLGIGKPNHFLNALYRRARQHPEIQLKIITALSLEKPFGASELEKRFIDPFVARVFGGYEDPDYIAARRSDTLPPNIQVLEFFMKPGASVDEDCTQQHYVYSNYTSVARDMLLQGLNVIAQAIAVEDGGDAVRYSWSANPEVTLDLLDLAAADNARPVFVVGCCNRKLPFMENDAVAAAADFDLILRDPSGTHEPFAPPNLQVSLQDYAIGIYASAFVKDGGTLQIGIGAHGDAIAQALIVREQHNDAYRQMIAALFGQAGVPDTVHTGRFAQGLYGCSEMFANGLMKLIQAGIIRREVLGHAGLQALINQKKLGLTVTAQTLAILREHKIISAVLSVADLDLLKKYGIVRDEVALDELLADPTQESAALKLGQKLKGGILMHAGFFLGPSDFYHALRELSPEMRGKIGMSRISFINALFGHEHLASLQRRDARFINTAMMVSLRGAAASDCLASGRVVSGVGGQYNLIAMAHALPDARSILMVRACRSQHGKSVSNIVWSYGQTTIPAHLRDIVVTEYGVADLRGQTDSECIKRLLAIADSRFQQGLLQQAKANGKIAGDYVIPDSQRNNTPAALAAALAPWKASGMLPDLPFGTDFDADELLIMGALKRLQALSRRPFSLAVALLKQLLTRKQIPQKFLQRMQLEQVRGMKLRLLRALFIAVF
ncbi:acetyl-CoA hydrolase/transferase C-terminal domain-containing protein [Undibacterium sp.]|uniref:acetyl-CoA hydrolase/transferase C-terminal domain-containing protein n=1 Tax=Undibacterium sp. TaxID=1914977 RepID=UPI002B837606|nr:acetyl-CoA hydrolase/transferase C-terminal domain-containing protein [Undibacterium sp.]HTD05971.1 acetyl-CoA hydrolase/transferase C-terminal domain-containing protein [Undibacterium sp.]